MTQVVPSAVGAGLSAGVNAYNAPAGQKGQAVVDSLRDAAPGAAQGVTNIGLLSALTKDVPGTSLKNSVLPTLKNFVNPGAGAQATWQGRAATMGKNLLNPRTMARGGALVGGVQGAFDLARWAKGSPEWQAAQDAQLRNSVMAGDGRSTAGTLGTAAGAAGRAMFTGNLDPARAEFGAAVGKMDPSGTATPAGRKAREARLELGATRAGNEGYEQTRNLLMQDPRFQNLDPKVVDQLAAEMGSEHAANGAMIDQQVQGNGQPNQASTQDLVRYTSALDKYNQGKASPQEMGYLQELAGGEAAGGKFSPEQLQSAGRNAMLYHRVGRENAEALTSGYGDKLQAALPQQQAAPQTEQAPDYQKPYYKQVIDHLVTNQNDPKNVAAYQRVVSQLPEQEKQLAANYLVEQQGNKAHPWANPAGNWVHENAPMFDGAVTAVTGQPTSGMMTNDQTNQAIEQEIGNQGANVGNAMQTASEQDFNGGAGGEGGGWMSYLKNNPSLGLLPMGLIGMMSGSRIGKVLGLMAILGGAYNLYNRYQSLQDPKFQQAAQARATAMAGKTWDQTREQQFQQQYGDRAQDLAAAQHAHLVDLPALARQKAKEMSNSVLPGHQKAPEAPQTPQQPDPAQPPQQDPQEAPKPDTKPVAQQQAPVQPTQTAAPQAAPPKPPVAAPTPPPAPAVAKVTPPPAPNPTVPQPGQPPKPLVPPLVPGKLS